MQSSMQGLNCKIHVICIFINDNVLSYRMAADQATRQSAIALVGLEKIESQPDNIICFHSIPEPFRVSTNNIINIRVVFQRCAILERLDKHTANYKRLKSNGLIES